ncbi:TPA: NUMOD3 domain-containing DNA-binding protein [Salmonella enterica subsp. enterica serovar Virchow]
MNLSRLYSQLIGTCEARNGKPSHPYNLRHRNSREGFEIHHITPRSTREHWFKDINDPSNLVYMTPREHYTAHHILARLYGGDQAFAFHGMSLPIQGNTGRSYTVSARQYATARALLSDYLRGRQFTDESREKMSKGQRLRFETQGVSAETRARLSAAGMGRQPTDETRAKLSAANAEQYTDLTCPHCGKVGQSRVMYRWHFDNCKMITGQQNKATNYPKLVCPHCATLIGSNIAHRYHFDNCKHKPS